MCSILWHFCLHFQIPLPIHTIHIYTYVFVFINQREFSWINVSLSADAECACVSVSCRAWKTMAGLIDLLTQGESPVCRLRTIIKNSIVLTSVGTTY